MRNRQGGLENWSVDKRYHQKLPKAHSSVTRFCSIDCSRKVKPDGVPVPSRTLCSVLQSSASTFLGKRLFFQSQLKFVFELFESYKESEGLKIVMVTPTFCHVIWRAGRCCALTVTHFLTGGVFNRDFHCGCGGSRVFPLRR